MSDNTKIEWTDATWNPITGCSVVSAGCKHCYAMKLAGTRMRNTPSRSGLTVDTKAGPVWNGKTRINHEWLAQPIGWKRPRRIFVCAHGDLFHESISDTTIAGIFGIMAACPQHTFQVLTKRALRAAQWFNGFMSEGNAGVILHEATKGLMGYNHQKRPAIQVTQQWPLPNVWLGVSVEDQAAADERIPLLCDTPAVIRFLSCEPLLGPVDVGMYLTRRHLFGFDPMGGIDWVIVGGESGRGARPMHGDWARAIRYKCGIARVPFFFKQWGEHLPGEIDHDGQHRTWTPHEAHIAAPLEYERVHVVEAHGEEFGRVGKRKAGRMLDGRTWDEMPQVAA